MQESILKNKSYAFALETIKASKFLVANKKEFTLSKQILRSGTAIGALIREAEFGQSRADFVNKMSIALKEANETLYWLELLRDSEDIKELNFELLRKKCDELVAMLVATVKTAKGEVRS
jgi:four helix bundle protein